MCMGVGMSDPSPLTNVWSQRAINPAIVMGIATTGQICRSNFSDLTDTVRSGEPLWPEVLDLLGQSAAKVAAITVGRPGADPPWLADVATAYAG